jgi:ABC-type uncharacterized transport system substrate-binding protein
VAIEYRWAENQVDQLPELTAELVRQQVPVFVTTGGRVAALAAKAATTTITIIFIGELTAKLLELLREMVPQAARIH